MYYMFCRCYKSKFESCTSLTSSTLNPSKHKTSCCTLPHTLSLSAPGVACVTLLNGILVAGTYKVHVKSISE